MQKQFWLLLSLVIFLSSGCILPSPTPSVSGGVVIETFEPEFSRVYSEEPVNFRLFVRNKGSVEATHVHAEVLGIDEDWCCETAGVPGEGPWRNREKLPNENECRFTDSKGFSLAAPDPGRGTSGGTHICTWSYRAPSVQQQFSLTYNPTVRVFYSYSSGIIKLITFGSSKELRTMQDIGSPLPSDVVSTTKSPVKLDIITKGPIRFWDSSVEFPLEITIENVGGGVACAFDGDNHKGACKKTAEGNPKDKVKVNIDAGDFDIGECAEKIKEPIPLYKGKTSTIVCRVTAGNLRTGGTSQKQITVRADYEYYIDKETSITVTGM